MADLIDFSSPTFLKSDLSRLKEELDNSANTVYFDNTLGDQSTGTNNDISYTTHSTYQKIKFPPLRAFPSFTTDNSSIEQSTTLNPTGTEVNPSIPILRISTAQDWIRLTNDLFIPLLGDNIPINASPATFVSVVDPVKRTIIVEIQNDLDLTSTINASFRVLEGSNILFRSTKNKKFTIRFNDATVGGANQGLITSFYSHGLCIKDLIFIHDQSASIKSTLLLDGLNGGRFSTDQTFDNHIDNVDFYYSKLGIFYSCPHKNLQITNCKFFNSGTAPNERALFIQGINNLSISSCKIKGNGTSLVFCFFGDNQNIFQKVTGDLFFDNIADETVLPNSIRQFINFESVATLSPNSFFTFPNTNPLRVPSSSWTTIGGNLPQTINLYVKDCTLRSTTSAYILFYTTSISGSTPPAFASFNDIVLYNNIYQNNLGKGLLFWDTPGSTSMISGRVNGKFYAQANNAIEKKYRDGLEASSSLVSLNQNITGENLTIAYASSKATFGSNITAVELEDFINSAKWMARPLTIPYKVLLQNYDIPITSAISTIMFSDLNDLNYNEFKVKAQFAPGGQPPGTNAGGAKIGISFSFDGGQTFVAPDVGVLTIQRTGLPVLPNANSNLAMPTGTFNSVAHRVIPGAISWCWSTRITINWKRKLVDRRTTQQDQLVIPFKIQQVTENVGAGKYFILLIERNITGIFYFDYW